MDLKLTSDMRRDLHDALLDAFPGDALERFIAHSLDFVEVDDLNLKTGHTRVAGLIGQAETAGKIRLLVRRARWSNRDNPRLQAFLGEHLHSGFPLPLLNALVELLARPGLTVELLSQAAWATRAPDVPRGKAGPADRRFLEDLVDQLADLQMCLLELAERVAVKVQAPLAPELRRWTDEAAAAVALGAELSELRRKLEAEAPAEPLFLLVKVDLAGREHFLLKIWKMDERGNGEVLAGGDGERHLLADLDRILEKALEAAYQKLGPALERARNRFTIEFALPRVLLCHPVERVRFDGGVGSLPLAMLQTVVLRAAERLSEPPGRPIWARWKEKWRAVLRGDPRDLGVMVFGTLEEFERERARAQLATHAYCVAFGEAAPRTPCESRHDPLRLGIIEPGVPIGLWVREPMSGAMPAEAGRNAASAVQALLEADEALRPDPRASDGADHLLAKMNQLRAGAFDEPPGTLRHAGHHVAVLWDDPRRVPAELRGEAGLEGPHKSGG